MSWSDSFFWLVLVFKPNAANWNKSLGEISLHLCLHLMLLSAYTYKYNFGIEHLTDTFVNVRSLLTHRGDSQVFTNIRWWWLWCYWNRRDWHALANNYVMVRVTLTGGIFDLFIRSKVLPINVTLPLQNRLVWTDLKPHLNFDTSVIAEYDAWCEWRGWSQQIPFKRQC